MISGDLVAIGGVLAIGGRVSHDDDHVLRVNVRHHVSYGDLVAIGGDLVAIGGHVSHDDVRVLRVSVRRHVSCVSCGVLLAFLRYLVMLFIFKFNLLILES